MRWVESRRRDETKRDEMGVCMCFYVTMCGRSTTAGDAENTRSVLAQSNEEDRFNVPYKCTTGPEHLAHASVRTSVLDGAEVMGKMEDGGADEEEGIDDVDILKRNLSSWASRET
jgi:hypothetical protein